MEYRFEGMATGFGEVARVYDRVRPGYPSALFEHIDCKVFALMGARILEVGSGTGIATVELVKRGAAVAAVEPDRRMAAVLREKLSVSEVHEAPFERLRLPRASFDLVVAAQSWHWVRQREGLRKASSLLREGGFFVAFWNLGTVSDLRLAASIVKTFSRIKREPPIFFRPRGLRQRIDLIEQSLARARDLVSLSRCEFSEIKEYRESAFMDLLATMSGVLALPPSLRPEVLAEIRSAMPAKVVVEYRTVMLCAGRG